MSPQSQFQYQTILPAPDASGGPGGQDPDKRVGKRRRANRPNACENCRVKKARVSFSLCTTYYLPFSSDPTASVFVVRRKKTQLFKV